MRELRKDNAFLAAAAAADTAKLTSTRISRQARAADHGGAGGQLEVDEAREEGRRQAARARVSAE